MGRAPSLQWKSCDSGMPGAEELLVDADGNVFDLDDFGTSVRSIDPRGVTRWRNKLCPSSPARIALTTQGDVIAACGAVGDPLTSVVQRVDAHGEEVWRTVLAADAPHLAGAASPLIAGDGVVTIAFGNELADIGPNGDILRRSTADATCPAPAFHTSCDARWLTFGERGT